MLGFGKKWDPPSSIYRLVNVLHCTLQNNLKVRSKHVICQYFNNASFFGYFLKTPINDITKILSYHGNWSFWKTKFNCVFGKWLNKRRKINHLWKHIKNMLPMTTNTKLLTGFDYKTLFKFFINKVKFYWWFFSLTRKFCCWVKD